ncbi:DUF3157 family protein [Shewanella sp. D64]|uniref:DUF3157 family protein n=1 Tax=unclassified Shewanella TaxID=196818 RepID=UPI0022BA306D|nr:MULTISPECIES: DUF3157 family protein [unclassified Shewanella]MEC4726289.1 DUF3157 family protein [Shewanella sp. D64]MEC4738301.1 DUF3157 family protein [Shewanella sp. E94]WBJ98316.1 DUF3157 family protein [Shewanella sp. MTB7]
MRKTFKTLTGLALLMLVLPAMAAELTTITLDNGAKVRLSDDFTWEYVILETEPSAPEAVIAASPIVSSSQAAQITAPATASTSTPTLTANAMAQAALLKVTAKDGVKVSFLKSQWDEDGRLGLTFDLASTSPEHYVLIELDVTLFDDTGKLLKTETIKVWKAIFRMPDTYLRKGQQRESRVFWIEGIDPNIWTKELMSLKIGEMDSRM